MAELCYLEFGADPSRANEAHRDLDRAGFRLRSKNSKDSVRFYSQGSAVIMLRFLPDCNFDYIGIGLAGSQEEIKLLDGEVDPDTNFTVGTDGAQRVTIIETHQVNQLIEHNFEVQDPSDQRGAAINYFSGIVIPETSDAVIAFWKNLGFDVSKVGQWTTTAVSPKRKFSILFSSQPRRTIVCDTNAIFDVVSHMLVHGFESTYAHAIPDSFNVPMLGKIQAYECSVFGNSESHSVEKFYPQALGSTDLLARERTQYLHIPENNLETHYGSIKNV